MARSARRVALVTGAANGVGRAIARHLSAFLLDGERSGFVTGANFVVDGGMTRKMIYVE